MSYDLVLTGAMVVQPHIGTVSDVDAAVRGTASSSMCGLVSRQRPCPMAFRSVPSSTGTGLAVFPGVVDAHPLGIYVPLGRRGAKAGPVRGRREPCATYFRTGQYYLNSRRPVRGVLSGGAPALARCTTGSTTVTTSPPSGLAPRRDEALAVDARCAVLQDLHVLWGLRPPREGRPRGPARLLDARRGRALRPRPLRVRAAGSRPPPRTGPRLEAITSALHCEIADILNAYTEARPAGPALHAGSARTAPRPPHSEGLGVWIAPYLAHEAACRNVNLLHLSSRKALEAALLMRDISPPRFPSRGHRRPPPPRHPDPWTAAAREGEPTGSHPFANRSDHCGVIRVSSNTPPRNNDACLMPLQ